MPRGAAKKTVAKRRKEAEERRKKREASKKMYGEKEQGNTSRFRSVSKNSSPVYEECADQKSGVANKPLDLKTHSDSQFEAKLYRNEGFRWTSRGNKKTTYTNTWSQVTWNYNHWAIKGHPQPVLPTNLPDFHRHYKRAKEHIRWMEQYGLHFGYMEISPNNGKPALTVSGDNGKPKVNSVRVGVLDDGTEYFNRSLLCSEIRSPSYDNIESTEFYEYRPPQGNLSPVIHKDEHGEELSSDDQCTFGVADHQKIIQSSPTYDTADLEEKDPLELNEPPYENNSDIFMHYPEPCLPMNHDVFVRTQEYHQKMCAWLKEYGKVFNFVNERGETVPPGENAGILDENILVDFEVPVETERR